MTNFKIKDSEIISLKNKLHQDDREIHKTKDY